MRIQSYEAKVATLHPKIRDEVKTVIEQLESEWPDNMAIGVPEAYRSIEYQDHLYTLGRTVKNPDGASPSKPYGNIVTNAHGGSSFHNYGLAIDFCLYYKGPSGWGNPSWDELKDGNGDGQKDWMEVVDRFKFWGYEWGGDWKSIKDDPHIQKRFGYSWQQLFQRYQVKMFIPGTQYVSV